MSRKTKSRDVQVLVGEQTVTISRGGSLNAAQARLLGDETTDGVRRLYLDRLVHLPREDELGDWACSGAVSTILERPAA